MKPKLFFWFVILTFILNSCNSEKKEIKGTWTNQKTPDSYTHYNFNRDGTFEGLVFEEGVKKFRHGSIGYYKYIGNREFNLYQVDIDFSPIIGKGLWDRAVGIYFMESMDSMVELDLDNTKPSYVAQLQGDGEHLRILQNDDVVIELKRKRIKFWDKR
jgi:hypothetical protein